MVEPEAVENRRLQVVHMDFIRGDVEAEFVGGAMRDARLDAAAGQPHRKRIGMVVAAPRPPQHSTRLHHRRPPELSTPHHQRAVEHPPLLEIGHQRGRAAVGLPRLIAHIPRHVGMGIPALVIDRDKPHPPLHEAAGDQTGSGKARLLRLAAIERERFGRFLCQIHQLRCRGLQPVGHLIAGDPGGDLRISIGRQPAAVEPADQIDRVGRQLAIGTGRRSHVENRIAGVAEAGAGVIARQKSARPCSRSAADAAGGVHHHKGGQIAALAPEAIRGPGADRGAARLGEAAVHENLRRGMVELIGAAALDDRDLIHHRRQLRQHLRDLGPRVAVLGKLELRRQHCGIGADKGIPLAADYFRRNRLPLNLDQLRLVIKELQLRRGPRHEELDHRLRLRRKVGRLGRQRRDGDLIAPSALRSRSDSRFGQ